MALLADSLYEVGKKLQIEGKLAEQSLWNEDRTVLTIKLKKISLSDGTPLTAQVAIKSISSCIFGAEKNTTSSFTKIVGFKEFVRGKSKRLKGLKIVDDRTFQIITTDFVPLIKENLASTACSTVKPSRNGLIDLFMGGIGTGPYLLKKKTEKEIELIKRSGAGPKRVIFFSTNHYGNFEKLKDKASLILVNRDPGPTPGFNKYPNSRLGNWQLSFNNEKPPFNKAQLRKALSLGLDYKFLTVQFGWNKTRLQEGLFPFGMRGFKKRKLNFQDIKTARKLLASLGYTDNKPLNFTLILSKRHGTEKAEKVWQTAFSKIPVKLNVRVLEQRKLIEIRNKGDFDVLMHGKASGSHDPHIILSSYLSNSRFNTPRVKNKKCDDLIKKSLETFDKETRWKKYAKAEKCLLDTHFIVPLATVNSGYALIKKPWKTTRKNMYLLYPYYVDEWVKE